MTLRDDQSLLLATLLHDVGALFGTDPPACIREIENDPVRHEMFECALDWADPRGHHDRALVAEPLVSAFTLLSSVNTERTAPAYFPYHALGPVDADMSYLFPQTDKPAGRADYLEEFHQAYEQTWARIKDADWETQFYHLVAVFQQYAWCLAAHSSDVCLFDHLHLAVALVAAIAKQRDYNLDDERPFYLAAGDLSGIPDYMFAIATVGGGGTSRRLRARSFSLAMLTDLASHMLVRAFDLPLTNVLMATGSKFYVLLPHLRETEAQIAMFRRSVDQWLYREYNGEIGLNLAYLRFNPTRLRAHSATAEGFGSLIARLHGELDHAKLRRHRTVLVDEAERYCVDKFPLDVNFHIGRACASCGKFPTTLSGDLCLQCARQSYLGSKLMRAEAIAFYAGSDMPPNVDVSFRGNYGAHVLMREDMANVGHPYLVLRLNDPNLAALAHYPAGFRYLANHIPAEHGIPLAFDQMARRAVVREANGNNYGRDMLGYVQADIDHLKRLFAIGLWDNTDQDHRDTAVHLAALSRELDLFFSGWLQHALSDPFKTFYSIFSGGGDLFVLGPWNVALEFAQTVNAQFRAFVCHNPAITLSAGIVYAPPDYAIARAASDVTEALEQSKKGGRDRLTVLGDTFPWAQTELVLREIARLSEFRVDEPGSAFLYRLVDYGEMYKDWMQTGNPDVAGFQSHLAATIAQNLRGIPTGQQTWADGLLDALSAAGPDANAIMERLGLIAASILFSTYRVPPGPMERSDS